MAIDGRVDLGVKLRGQFREWLGDILESVSGSQLADCDFPERVQGCCMDLDKYNYYFKNHDLTEREYNDLAEIVLRRFLKNIEPKDVRMFMANDIDILLDAEKSLHWLSPFVVAERTSLAYERGLRLIEASQRDLARSIMQDAANRGDIHCAMYLIKNRVVGDASYDDMSCDWMKEANKPISDKSVAYDSAMLFVRWSKYQKAEEVLRSAAECGDVECALYLIRQTLNRNAADLFETEVTKDLTKKEWAMKLKTGRDMRYDDLKKDLVPVTIAWNRDAIIAFLLTQYKDGNEEAADLLYLQLHNDIRARILEHGGSMSTTEIVEIVKGFTDYPESIVASMLKEIETGDVEFSAPILKDPEVSEDEMPF